MVAPSGRIVAPSWRRGPMYCPIRARSPISRETVALLVGTLIPKTLPNTFAVSACPTADLVLAARDLASSKEISSTRISTGKADIMLSEKAFNKNMSFSTRNHYLPNFTKESLWIIWVFKFLASLVLQVNQLTVQYITYVLDISCRLHCVAGDFTVAVYRFYPARQTALPQGLYPDRTLNRRFKRTNFLIRLNLLGLLNRFH